MMSIALCLGFASAFMPPATMQPLSHVSLSSVADISMMAARKPASPTKPTVGKNAKPLSPGSNYPTTKNIQKQKSGFGSFVQKFQVPRLSALHAAAAVFARRWGAHTAGCAARTFNALSPLTDLAFVTVSPQTVSGKSKYGVPIFLPSGNVNPAYLAAERKELAATTKMNMKTAEAKRKKLIAKGEFELADYIKKKIGEVGSGLGYYQSGK